MQPERASLRDIPKFILRVLTGEKVLKLTAKSGRRVQPHFHDTVPFPKITYLRSVT